MATKPDIFFLLLPNMLFRTINPNNVVVVILTDYFSPYCVYFLGTFNIRSLFYVVIVVPSLFFLLSKERESLIGRTYVRVCVCVWGGGTITRSSERERIGARRERRIVRMIFTKIPTSISALVHPAMKDDWAIQVVYNLISGGYVRTYVHTYVSYWIALVYIEKDAPFIRATVIVSTYVRRYEHRYTRLR